MNAHATWGDMHVVRELPETDVDLAIKEGFTDRDSLPLPNLKKYIHPLFDQKQFVNTLQNGRQGKMTDRLYERLKPALQLASCLLDQEPTLAFLYRVSHGTLTTDNKSGRTYLADTTSEDLGLKDRHKQMVRERLLNQFVENSTIVLATPLTDEAFLGIFTKLECCWAYARLVPDRKKSGSTQTEVVFRPCFHHFLSIDWDTATASDRIRCLFFFAKTLMREFAHVAGFSSPCRRPGLPEPYCNLTDVEPELGRALEVATFGRMYDLLSVAGEHGKALSSQTWTGWYRQYMREPQANPARCGSL